MLLSRTKAQTIFSPSETCLYLGGEQIQHVHNIIVAEEGAELHIISGCKRGACG